MKIFAILAEGYSEAVAYKGGKEVNWTKITFTQNPAIMKSLEPKCKDFPVKFAPLAIQAFASMLEGHNVDFKIVYLELDDKEAINLSKKHNQLIFA